MTKVHDRIRIQICVCLTLKPVFFVMFGIPSLAPEHAGASKEAFEWIRLPHLVTHLHGNQRDIYHFFYSVEYEIAKIRPFLTTLMTISCS